MLRWKGGYVDLGQGQVDVFTSPPVLATDFEQRMGDLPERADANCVHQHFERVASASADDGLLLWARVSLLSGLLPY